MTQDDMPAPAVVDEEKAVKEEETAVIEYVPPSPPVPSPKPKPAKFAKAATPPQRSAAPDPFAVGVRVLKMAPAWLLFTAVCCSALVLLLGWVRATGEVEAMPIKRNDARAVKAEKAAAKPEAGAPASASLAVASGPKTTAANDAPAPAPSPQPAAEAPEGSTAGTSLA